MQSYELHDEIKKMYGDEKKEILSDVYHDQNKILKFKELCIKNFSIHIKKLS
jgi:hypothetical protein